MTYEVEAAGIELRPNSLGKHGVSRQGGAECGAHDAREVATDSELGELIEAWPSLPEAIKAGILAIIRAAK